MINIKKRNELVIKYMPLAEKLANSRKRKVKKKVALDELKSAAYLGLIDAANKYNNEKASKNSKDPFASYATRRITGQMTDYLRNCYWMGTRKNPIPMYSLDSNTPTDDDEYGNFAKNSLESRILPPYEILNREELFKRIIKALPSKAQAVFKSYYLESKTMKQIGKEVGLSESRISQMLSQYTDFLGTSLQTKKEELFNEAGFSV